MKKQILKAIGLAAIAALLCATCDNGLDRSPTHAGDVDRFLGRINPTDTTGGGTPTTPTTYTLTVSRNIASGGDVSRKPDKPAGYNPGENVTVTATPKTGYGFKEWSGAASGTANPVTIKMDGNKTLTANFVWQDTTSQQPDTTYELIVIASPVSGGSVSLNPDLSDYEKNADVTATAMAYAGYRFTGWAGAATGTTNPVTITMNGNKTLTAEFEQLPKYTVRFNINGGSGTTPGAQTVNAGSSITLPGGSGLTKGDSTFGGWNTNASGTGTNYNAGASYTVNSTVTLYVKWSANPVTPPSDCTFVDIRDGKSYRWVKIGTQKWMGQNLNYDVKDVTSDVCYGGSDANCVRYGRLYNWATAMGGVPSSSLSPSGVQGVCPDGWHIPSDAEWTVLVNYAGGESMAGTKLKSKSGWNSNGNGTDESGFSALPGGTGNSGGSFSNAGNNGYWWSATEDGVSDAWVLSMYFTAYVGSVSNLKVNLFSVRCVADR